MMKIFQTYVENTIIGAIFFLPLAVYFNAWSLYDTLVYVALGWTAGWVIRITYTKLVPTKIFQAYIENTIIGGFVFLPLALYFGTWTTNDTIGYVTIGWIGGWFIKVLFGGATRGLDDAKKTAKDLTNKG